MKEQKQKVRNITGMVNISGFPSPYESSCQIMLQKGYEWIVTQKDVDLKATTYQNVYGLLTPESDDAKELSEVITNDIPGGVTGAMHQAVMSHLIYIAKHGVDEWRDYVHKKRADNNGIE